MVLGVWFALKSSNDALSCSCRGENVFSLREMMSLSKTGKNACKHNTGFRGSGDQGVRVQGFREGPGSGGMELGGKMGGVGSGFLITHYYVPSTCTCTCSTCTCTFAHSSILLSQQLLLTASFMQLCYSQDVYGTVISQGCNIVDTLTSLD